VPLMRRTELERGIAMYEDMQLKRPVQHVIDGKGDEIGFNSKTAAQIAVAKTAGARACMLACPLLGTAVLVKRFVEPMLRQAFVFFFPNSHTSPFSETRFSRGGICSRRRWGCMAR